MDDCTLTLQAEARKLALTADHSDPVKGAHMSGLSIWMALTTFFSNSSERHKAKEAIKKAHDDEESRTTLPARKA